MQRISAHTVADSISSDLPRDRVKALRAVRQTGGAFVAVPDDAIVAAIPALAQATGVFVEPACAAAYAGLRKALSDGLIRASDRVVLLGTGNGLKDIRGAMRAVGKGHPIGRTFADLEAALSAQ